MNLQRRIKIPALLKELSVAIPSTLNPAYEVAARSPKPCHLTPLMKLRVVEEIRIGFDFYFFDRIFFAYGEWLSAEGRIILTIRLILSN